MQSTRKLEKGLPSKSFKGNFYYTHIKANGKHDEIRDSLEEEDEMALQNEVDILSQLDHPTVVKLYEIFDERDFMYLVLEIMTGGEVKLLISF